MLFNYEIQATLVSGEAMAYGHVDADTLEKALTEALSVASSTAGWDEWPRGTNADVTVWPKGEKRTDTERTGQLMVR